MNPELKLGLPLSSDEEYGSGSEIASTDYIILGILTFWFYTSFKYLALLQDHFKKRGQFFKEKFVYLSEKYPDQNKYSVLFEKEVQADKKIRLIKNVIPCFYLLSGLIFVCRFLILSNFDIDVITGKLFLVFLSFATIIFLLNTFLFIFWVAKKLRDHEYNELLILELLEKPITFNLHSPSNEFIRRWERKNNLLALFLILSIPVLLSLIMVATYTQNRIVITPYPYILSTVFLATFHFFGTCLIIDLYNSHLRFEREQMRIMRQKPTPNLAEQDDNKKTEDKYKIIPKRQLTAIMLTDIVGYSKSMEKDESHAYLRLMNHNEIIRANILKYEGKEIKTMGDAFLVIFDSAVDAVDCAIAIQSEFGKYNSDKSDINTILVRIGIHIGDILIAGNDILGDGVNVTSRIEPLAEPGGICISETVYNIVKNKIKVKVENMGCKTLKNIEELQNIYKIIFNHN